LNEIIAKGGKPNLVCYNILLIGLCKEGRIEEAIHLFRDFSFHGVQSKCCEL